MTEATVLLVFIADDLWAAMGEYPEVNWVNLARDAFWIYIKARRKLKENV